MLCVMHVAHVVREVDPAKGGTTTVILNTVEAQARAGATVELWTLDPYDAAPTGVTVRTGPPKDAAGRFDRGFLDAFASRLSGVDVIHLHELWSPYAARFVFAARDAGVSTVHTMHGMLMRWPMSHRAWKKRLYLAAVGRRQLAATSVVHFLNRNETLESAATGVRCRVFEAPNGIDVSTFRADAHAGAFRRAHPEVGDRPIIASMGRLHEIKGTDLALEAFLSAASSHPEWVLVLAGADEGLRDRLESVRAAHPAGDRVLMPGLVTGAERFGLLADASVFLHASRHETASMAILEAAYAGCAVVATTTSNCPEIEAAGAGVMAPPTVEGLASGLATMLGAPERIAAMGEAGRRLIASAFTLDAVTPRLLELYERLRRGEVQPDIRSIASR